MDFFSTTKTLGILGGGQLGKMLLYSTRKWDIKTKVLDPSVDAPARLAANEFVKGDLTDFQTVYDFGKDVDILTIEIEKVNVQALEKLEQEGVAVYPQPHVLKTIQNKCLQKKFYRENNIPTASFDEFDSINDVKNAVLKGNLSFPFVWKSAEMGYDGYGVSIVRSNKELEELKPGPCLIEEMINFKRLSYTELVEFISYFSETEIREFKKGSLLKWAEESKNLRDGVYPSSSDSRNYCHKGAPETTFPLLSYPYSFKHFDNVEKRMFQAGVRLAYLLNNTF